MLTRKSLKYSAVFFAATAFIGVISVSEASETTRDPIKSHLIDSRAMIEDDFSGLELKPIVDAIFSWKKETQGDIDVMPPTEADGIFYDVVINGEVNGKNIFNIDLSADAANFDP